MDLSGLKSIKRIYLNNFFLSFKNMYKYFSPYSRFFDFDNVDLILLFLEYLTVPYYYLEEWFRIQLESYITYIKILLIKYYSNPKYKITHSNMIYKIKFYIYSKL